MNSNDFLLLGLKNKVTALSRLSGEVIWCIDLPKRGLGASGFITLTCDDSRIYAYSDGHLHCLDLKSGRLLWSNDLPGYGFGLASLCVPGFNAAPDAATIRHYLAQQESSAAAPSSTTPSSM